MPPLVADGATTGVVRLWVDDGVRPKVKAATGELGPMVVGADGIVAVPYTPARSDVPGAAALAVSADGVDVVVQVPIVPPFGEGTLSVTFDPQAIEGGKPAVVRVTPSDPSPVPAEHRRVLLTASIGDVTDPVPDGSGGWIATYTPPKRLTGPTAAVLAAVDVAAPEVRGHGVLPITFHDKVSFPAPAGTANVLHVGERQYGPAVAAANGQVTFELDLDVRLPAGFITTVATSGERTDKAVILPRAPPAIVSWLGAPPAVRAGGSPVSVPLLVIGSNGLPKDDAAIVATATGGALGDPRWDDGVYTVSFTPPPAAGDVVLAAEVDGVRSERRIRVVAPLGVLGLGVTDRGSALEVTATGPAAVASSSGKVRDQRDGSFAISVDPAAPAIRVSAAPPLTPTGLAPVRIVAWPDAPVVALGGSMPVTIAAVDALGVPVPNVELALSVTLGDGSVPATVRTDARGVATVPYTAGHAAGLRGIRAVGAGLATEAPIVQQSGPAPLLLPGGAPDADASLAALRAAFPATTVSRGSPAAPTAIEVATAPLFTTPGAALVVAVRLTGDGGRGVPGQALGIGATAGTVGPVADHGDGWYVFTVSPAADAPLELTIGAAGVTRTTVVRRLADAGDKLPTAKNEPPDRVRAARPPPPERALARLGVAFVNRHGRFTQGGTLADDLVGNVAYGTPIAGFVGLRADALLVPLAGPWGAVGLDARAVVQAELLSVADAKIERVPLEVNGGIRYTFEIGAVSFGLAGGLHRYTNILLKYEDGDRASPGFLVLPALGPRLGPVVSIDAAPLTVDLEAARTFVADGVSDHAEVVVEYALAGSTGVRLGASADGRSWSYVTSDGEGVADASQYQILAFVGLGLRY